MDKYNVTGIGDGEYEVNSDRIEFTSKSIVFYKMGKIDGSFPIKKTSFVMVEDEEQEDPHTKYKSV